MSEIEPVNVGSVALAKFKTFVLKKHGSLRVNLHKEATTALKTYLNLQNVDTEFLRLAADILILNPEIDRGFLFSMNKEQLRKYKEDLARSAGKIAEKYYGSVEA
jgi:hypothetical protein